MVQIALRFAPLSDGSGPLAGRTLSILPISDHTDPLRQVRKPERDLRSLSEGDLGRVVRQVHWSGFVTEQSLYEVAAKGAVMQQIQEGYRRFISGFLRQSSALRKALAEGGPGESPDRLR